MKHIFSTVAAIALLGGAAVATPASAAIIPTISIGVSETAGTPVVLPTANAVSSGIAVSTFTTANFSGVISAQGSPTLPQPTLNTSSLAASTTTGGTLYIYITEQGLSSPQGINSFISGFTSNLFTGGAKSVQEITYISTTNALFGGTVLSSTTFNGLGSVSLLSQTPSLTTPYSETVEFIVTMQGPGSVNDSINISVPEPVSLSILGMGLFGLGMVRRRKA